MKDIIITEKELYQYFKMLSNVNILILGDVGLDEYIIGDVKRISPEAPVPVVEVNDKYFRLGLSANVLANIVSLGANAELISVVGEDNFADELKEEFAKLGLKASLYRERQRKTTIKTRVIADALHHVARIDMETKLSLEEGTEQTILEEFKSKIGAFNLVILEDYAKGVFYNREFIQEIIRIARENTVPVFIDPNRNTTLDYYKGATLLKPNRAELQSLSKIDKLKDSVKLVYNALDLDYLLVTLGKEGMLLKERNKESKLDSFAIEVFDVSGAGDTVIASLASFYGLGIGIEKASYIANIAAATVVSKVGTAIVKQEDIVLFLKEHVLEEKLKNRML